MCAKAPTSSSRGEAGSEGQPAANLRSWKDAESRVDVTARVQSRARGGESIAGRRRERTGIREVGKGAAAHGRRRPECGTCSISAMTHR